MKKLVVLLFMGIILVTTLLESTPEYDLIEHRVSSGDTLCSIVSKHTGDSYDYREYVYLTKKENPDLEVGNLQVGQKILIAVPKER